VLPREGFREATVDADDNHTVSCGTRCDSGRERGSREAFGPSRGRFLCVDRFRPGHGGESGPPALRTTARRTSSRGRLVRSTASFRELPRAGCLSPQGDPHAHRHHGAERDK
jgi:hypothetical protein